MARRRMAIGKYKMGIAHAGTKQFNNGGGSIPDTFEILETEAGTRSLTGASQTITESRSTAEVVNIGDVVKYVNLFVQVSPRDGQGALNLQTGWCEWAFVCVKESETTVPITNVGTETLGVICNHMFRNECIYTGNFPVGNQQSNSLAIQIKIPRSKQTIRFGDEWRFITWWRSSLSTDTSTVAMRTVKSFMYKAYK